MWKSACARSDIWTDGVEVIYSQAGKFGGAGIGTTAYHLVRGIHAAGCLKKALVAYDGGHDLPPGAVRTFPWMRVVARLARDNGAIRDAVFDRAASHFIEPCDVFHGWSHQCLLSMRTAKRMGAVTFVERPNAHDRFQRRLLEEEFDRWGSRATPPVRPSGMQRGLTEYDEADFVTVPSRFAFESMVAEGIPESRLFLLPYGVDSLRFTPAARRREDFRLLFAGQVSLRKGVPYLFEAWKKLRLPGAELQLAGRVTPDAQRVVEAYRDEASIRFLGHVRDVPPLYREASAFVLPSIEEGSALVTYEAMAAGLPVICTPNAGAVVRDEVEGIEVPIRDADALASAIERLFRNPELRQEMGVAGRRRAGEFTWEAAAGRLVDAYRTALESRQS
jgi:glycosyltransferase involved in cell wall biosynthesis